MNKNVENYKGIVHQYNHCFSLFYSRIIKNNKTFYLLILTKHRLYYLVHNFTFRNFMFCVMPYTSKIIKKIKRVFR